jgi:hypothetical protein
LTDEPDVSPLFNLERYAGWLAKDHVSIAVRANVKALAVAMELGDDTTRLLETLDKDIGRLPGGSVRKMLRQSLVKMRVALGAGDIDVRHREDS